MARTVAESRPPLRRITLSDLASSEVLPNQSRSMRKGWRASGMLPVPLLRSHRARRLYFMSPPRPISIEGEMGLRSSM